jgi:glycosyltransferase involved in cell wall biosynthesis
VVDDDRGRLISVCIPTRNGGRWLREAIDSALAQTHADFELLIVDDASSDDTVAIARSYADPRIRFESNRVALGLPGNWNRCVELARGAYVKFLFQDDTLEPTCLAEMVAILAAEPRVGLVFSRRRIVLENPRDWAARWWKARCGDRIHNAIRPLSAVNDGRVLLRRCLLHGLSSNRIGEPTAVMVRKSCLDEIGLFDPRLRQIVDWEMWLRLMAHADVGFVDAPLVTFRVHAASATADNKRSSRARYDGIWLWRSFLRHGLARALSFR